MSGVLAALIASVKRALVWNSANASNSLTHTAAAYALLANAKYFGFGAASSSITTATNRYNYSLDGASWSSGTLPASIQGRAAASNGSRVVVASNTTTTYYSDNGTTWTASGSMGAVIKVEGIWNGSRFIFATNTAASGIAHSTDGTSWTIYANANATGIGFDGVSTYITVNTGVNIARINTTDITSSAAWSNITLPATIPWTSIKHNGSIWVAAGQGSFTYATSTNGTTWTQRTLPAIFSGSGTGVRAKMAVLDGKFYYLNFASPNANIYSSSDGINWTLEATISSSLAIAQAWSIGEGQLIAFGMGSSTVGTAEYVRGS